MWVRGNGKWYGFESRHNIKEIRICLSKAARRKVPGQLKTSRHVFRHFTLPFVQVH